MIEDKIMEIDFKDTPTDFPLDRRDFLKLTGAGIVILFSWGDLKVFAQERQGRGLPSDFNAFLRIGENGRVSCFTGKIEMGQGVITSLAQMLADELDVSLDSVDMVMGNTDLCPWDMGTFGSMTTRFFGPPLRAAAAEGRQVLKELASKQLNVPLKNLVTENGVVYDKNNRSKKVTYAELAKGQKIKKQVSEKVPVKKPSEFNIIGKPVKRRDGYEKVTGKAKYAGDIQLPGMLYARILRPPAHGAKLTDIDLSEARKVKGIQVVQDKDLIAVLHEYPDVADNALSKIKANYKKPETGIDDKNIFDHLLKVAPKGEVVSEAGDIKKGEADSANIIESTFLDGYKAHAPIEPHTAVVKIEGKEVTIWASSQTPFPAKDEIARILNISANNVHVISPFVGGGFGGKSRNLQIEEAARLAKLTGKPVQVAWSREDEFFDDSFRPAAIVKIRSGINSSGAMTFWDYGVYFAGTRGSEQFYDIPNNITTGYNTGWTAGKEAHPFATGPWRAPGNNTNTFARESQIDIMAAAAGIDPVEFRLKHLKNEKIKKVLKTAAEKFGWTTKKFPSGRGFGAACGLDAGTWVAAMAEVKVNKDTGAVKVNRVVAVQDMGLCINPEGAAIQMEGCIMMGLGYTLTEDIHFKNGEIFDLNFDTYELPRFSWLPKIDTHIIDNQNEPAQGGGEPAIVVMGAVIANAIYDAVGARLYQLPMIPERVKAAIPKG
jgi:nicotinate dehydrogenase subunit B